MRREIEAYKMFLREHDVLEKAEELVRLEGIDGIDNISYNDVQRWVDLTMQWCNDTSVKWANLCELWDRDYESYIAMVEEPDTTEFIKISLCHQN